MIVLLTHTRGHFDEDLVFARFRDITFTEFEWLADLSHEERLLLSCHVAFVAVLEFFFLLLGSCYAIVSSRHGSRRDTYTNTTAMLTCSVTSLLTISHS